MYDAKNSSHVARETARATPTTRHHAVARYVTPEEFATNERAVWSEGFLMVSATPLTRSIYHARTISSG